MNAGLPILIFLAILSIITFVLAGYFIYLSIKKLPKIRKYNEKLLDLPKKDILDILENKETNKIFIVGLIALYLFSIEIILQSYFFPDPDLSTIFQDFRQHTVMIELIFSLIALSQIPAFYFIKKEFNLLQLKNVPLVIVLGVSGIPAIFALTNTWLTGDLLFSTVLVVFGIMITLLALKFRKLEDIVNLTNKEIQPEKMIQGLIIYLIELDALRNPIPLGLTPISLTTISELLFKQGERHYFIKNNHDLHKKTRIELEPYFREIAKIGYKDNNKLMILFFIVFFLIFGTFTFIFDMYLGLNEIISILLMLMTFSIFFVSFFALILTKIRRTAGEKYDADIKKAVQELVDYGQKFIVKESLDPAFLPIKLRHNDYNNLEYGINGENNYISVFKLLNDTNNYIENNGYLVCQKCNGYYELEPDESPENFEDCDCGGKLKHHKNIDWLFEENDS